MASDSSTSTSHGVLSFLGVTVVLFVVTICAIGLLSLTGSSGQTLEQRRAAGRTEVRMRLEKEAQEKLHSEGWVDKAKGLVHVSIDSAVPLAVAELRNKKPAPSQIKVEPPLPIFVPDPNSKEPPPPLMPSAPQGAITIRFTPPSTPEPAAPAATPAPAAAPAATPAPAAAPAAPAPAPAPAASVPVPAPAPVPPAPAPVPTPESKPVPAPPAPAPAPAPEAKPTPPPAAPAPAPATEPAPSRPPLINPTENPAPTK